MSMIGKSFDNLPQRSVYYFLATYPSFYPVKAIDATEEEQENAYLFIKNIYVKLYENPSLLGFK